MNNVETFNYTLEIADLHQRSQLQLKAVNQIVPFKDQTFQIMGQVIKNMMPPSSILEINRRMNDFKNMQFLLNFVRPIDEITKNANELMNAAKGTLSPTTWSGIVNLQKAHNRINQLSK